MNRRLVGNPGVDALGVSREAPLKKPKRTPGSMFVLGPEVVAMLAELAEAKRVPRAEVVRTLIVNAHRERKQRLLANEERAGFGSIPDESDFS